MVKSIYFSAMWGEESIMLASSTGKDENGRPRLSLRAPMQSGRGNLGAGVQLSSPDFIGTSSATASSQ
ncbi:MAG: hypothetical protein HY666_02650 [Chloroflexi bacterium]|nr:hypothetical protein [Chloroflexota bacterium]